MSLLRIRIVRNRTGQLVHECTHNLMSQDVGFGVFLRDGVVCVYPSYFSSINGSIVITESEPLSIVISAIDPYFKPAESTERRPEPDTLQVHGPPVEPL